MTGIEWLTHEHFAPLVGQDVVVDTGGEVEGEVSMRLVEATAGTQPGGLGPDGQQRMQFSLLFRGPADRVLPQGTYAVTHEALGRQELFLVPLGRDADGVRYEAVFA